LKKDFSNNSSDFFLCNETMEELFLNNPKWQRRPRWRILVAKYLKNSAHVHKSIENGGQKSKKRQIAQQSTETPSSKMEEYFSKMEEYFSEMA
jgi:hypothetical protein